MSIILFPSQPFEGRTIDPDFAGERAAALRAGFATSLVDHTRVTRAQTAQAVELVAATGADAVFRGWMLTPSQYEAMFSALASRGVWLLNDPAAYRHCHYLPESYAVLEGHTPRTTWVPLEGELDMTAVVAATAPFGDGPVIVKDYVKSQKHYWNEACFVPSASDTAALERVVRRFLELQGESLNEGLVFREYAPLKIVGEHPRSGMPLAAELRVFWLDGEVVLAHRYWADLVSFDDAPPLDELRSVASKVQSRFFTMDVALRTDGRWTVVELGDGQVAGLPDPRLANDLYRRLGEILRSRSETRTV